LKWFLGPQEVGWRGVEASTGMVSRVLREELEKKIQVEEERARDLNSKMDAIATAGNEFQRSLLLLVGAGVVALVY
jgi:hypothetical protein